MVIRFGDAFKPDDAAELDALQLKELKNGRLAMVRYN
jgi:Chlorophyll A-B binding protein